VERRVQFGEITKVKGKQSREREGEIFVEKIG
jgi:hypothetical protein